CIAGLESSRGKCEGRVRRDAFFFSSRRRHTRWPRDWSSDVCSSDLTHPRDADTGWRRARRCRSGRAAARAAPQSPESPAPRPGRSEERRVGKECRNRRSAEPEKKKKKKSRSLTTETSQWLRRQ